MTMKKTQGVKPFRPDLLPSGKLYFSIGEVSKLFQLEPHIIRYWESEFNQLKPVRRHKCRYYRRSDILLIAEIRKLLYEEGFTIRGACAQLNKNKRKNKALSLDHLMNDLNKVIAILE